MYIRLTGDSNVESGVGSIVLELSEPLKEAFSQKDYGDGLLGLVIVLMCRDKELGFERRVKFARKEKKIYMDILLDIDELRPASPELRKIKIADSLLRGIPEVVRQFEIDKFNLDGLLGDLRDWLGNRGIQSTLGAKI